jgi:hypothetical protein
MSNHTGRLVLAPRDALQVPRPDALIAGLQAARFLGARLEPCLAPALDPALNRAGIAAAGAFALGEDFLCLITFAGCAVQVDLDAGTGRPFCHLRVVGPSPRPLALFGGNTRPPRCPSCRAPQRDWRQYLGAADPTLVCPACGTQRPAWAWDWRQSGGFARLSLWIEEIFPGEAAPTDALFDLLSDLSAMPWRHFYLQDT